MTDESLSERDVERLLTSNKSALSTSQWARFLRSLGVGEGDVRQAYAKRIEETNLVEQLHAIADGFAISLEEVLAKLKDEIFNEIRNSEIDKLCPTKFLKARQKACCIYSFVDFYNDPTIWGGEVRSLLDISETQLRQIQGECPNDVQERKYRAVLFWAERTKLKTAKKISQALTRLKLYVDPDFLHIDEIPSDDESVPITEELILRRALKATSELILGNRERDPVPLLVVDETRSLNSQCNAESWSVKRNNPIDDMYLDIDKLIPSIPNQSGDASLVKRPKIQPSLANAVGVIGIAGIGKTTLVTMLLEHHNLSFIDGDLYLIFFVSLRNLNYIKKMNVCQFLMNSVSDWEHSPERDKQMLKLVSKMEGRVLILMDGLDEAPIPGISDYEPTVKLYENAKAGAILKSLLNTHLLPKAAKLVTSRPGSFVELHQDYKPKFMRKVVGLSEESQVLLCHRICETEEDHLKVMSRLHAHPVSALSYVPMFHIMIVTYLLREDDVTSDLSIAGIFVSTLDECIRSRHFRGTPDTVRKLGAIALKGLRENRSDIKTKELTDCGLEKDHVEPFLSIKILHNKDIRIKILECDSAYHFAHLIWRSFFAAAHILFHTESNEEFRSYLSLLRDDRWDSVIKFLFGICNPTLSSRLLPLFSTSEEDFDCEPKRRILTDFLLNSTATCSRSSRADLPVQVDSLTDVSFWIKLGMFLNRPSDPTFVNLCTCAYELNDPAITTQMASLFPPRILLSRSVSQGDMASVCHVLKSCSSERVINVGVFGEPATLLGNGLSILLDLIQGTAHKINKLHVEMTKVPRSVLLSLCQQFDALDELELKKCNFNGEEVELLMERVQKRPTKMMLVLSGNAIEDRGVSAIVRGLDKIKALGLSFCGLAPDNVKMLVDKLITLEESIKHLNLSHNRFGRAGVDHLAKAIHKIDWLEMMNCQLIGADLEKFADAVNELNRPINVLNLRGNRIGCEGARHLAKCAQNIRTIWMKDCGIRDAGVNSLAEGINTEVLWIELNGNQVGPNGLTDLSHCISNIAMLSLAECGLRGSDMKQFADKIENLSSPVSYMDLRNNKLGSAGATYLSQCISNLDWLELANCELTGSDAKVLAQAINKRSTQMKMLNLSNNKLEDEGARWLSSTLERLQMINVQRCGFTATGVDALRASLANCKTCHVIGLKANQQ